MNKGDKVHVEFDAVYVDKVGDDLHTLLFGDRKVYLPATANITMLLPQEPPVGTMVIESLLGTAAPWAEDNVVIVYWHTPQGWKLVANTSQYPGEVPRDSSWEEIHGDMKSAEHMDHWKVTVIEP